MNGWTGINASVAKQNIDEFKDSAQTIRKNLHDTFKNLAEDLKQCWASQNAVLFNTTANDIVADMLDSIDTHIDTIVGNAIRAYNIVARQQGGKILAEERSVKMMFVRFHWFQNVFDIYGVSGMNITMIRDTLIPTFTASINSITTSIESLPKSIALYDDENGQRHAYETGITNMQNTVNECVAEVISMINKSLTTEIDNTLLAKQQATDVMSTTA